MWDTGKLAYRGPVPFATHVAATALQSKLLPSLRDTITPPERERLTRVLRVSHRMHYHAAYVCICPCINGHYHAGVHERACMHACAQICTHHICTYT